MNLKLKTLIQQGLILHLTLSSLLLSSPLRAETIEHGGTSFWIYRFDPATETLDLHLPRKAGTPNKFPDLKASLESKGKKVKFLANSGIFEGNFRPTGLHVARGKEITPLNTDDFVKEREGQLTPNFFLKPSGVFFYSAMGDPGIRKTSDFPGASLSRPELATQSGPLLVFDNTFHPILGPDSESKRYRNGVGVTSAGKIIFACSVLERDKGMSNLYNFASLFRDKLGCPDALYLDGDISYCYIEGVTPAIEETNWFAGIFSITEKEE